MIIKLSKGFPLRLKSPIFNNVISRSKYKLYGIQEDKYIGGFVLPNNREWYDFYKKTHLKYITIGRLLVYVHENDHIIGFDYFGNIKSWTLYETTVLKNIIESEIEMYYKNN
jgi:hypothetical protein